MGVRYALVRMNGSNALAGIFCFWTFEHVASQFEENLVLMPLRAFFVFGPTVALWVPKGVDSSNALAGIFCFL